MGIVLTLSTLALRQLVDGACNTVGVSALAGPGDAVAGFLVQHFTDHSQRLTQALQNANDRAWRSLEITLAGDTLWDRCKGLLAPREEQSFREQVQAFLVSTPLAALPRTKAEFCRECLRELRAARKAGLLAGGALEAKDLARHARAFARFADPKGLLDAEWGAVKGMAHELGRQGCTNLAQLLALRPSQGAPLLVIAVRYFFRREVEEDEQLFRGLAWASWTALSETQKSGFDSLARALADQGRRLEALLGDVRVIVEDTHNNVLDIKADLNRQGQHLQELGRAITEALDRHRVSQREVRPGDSLSIRNDGERQLVKDLVARYRALPAEQRKQWPALLNALGKLEVATGEFDAAQRDFQTVAALVPNDPKSQAEAHYNAYQAALERREWDGALQELFQAIRGDKKRFAPFPVARYRPERILGAGGFGVAFLCRHGALDAQVVVKILIVDDLEQDIERVFTEARLLGQLNHPAIIRLWDCGYLDPGKKSRPYLVIDYFDGPSLEEYVRTGGPLSPRDARAVARPVAEALQAAHAQTILHRDVKPANVLVRREESGWQVRLIDFGLALKQNLVQAADDGPRERSILGSSIAGTLEYAAPEQMGRVTGVAVGPYSDVYGFGRTCYYALLGTPEPDDEERKRLPVGWRKLLSNCTARVAERRPAAFADVLKRLTRMRLAGVPRKAKRPVPAAGKGAQTGRGAVTGGAPASSPPAPGGAREAQLVCPHCGQRLKIRAADTGRRLRCPVCQGEFLTTPPKG